MKVILVRSFLSLCFILFSGYGQMQALAGPRPANQSQSWLTLRAESASAGTENNGSDVWGLSYSSQEQKTICCKIDAAEIKEGEEDEHEVLSLKGRLKDSGSVSSIFFEHAPSYFHASDERLRLSFGTIFYTVSCRYLVFGVFRI